MSFYIYETQFESKVNVQKLIDGKLHTRDTIVVQYTNLVRSLAFRLSGEYEVDDLISEGYIGLLHAFDRFEPDKNLKFASYAHKSIRGQMLKLTRRPATGPHYPHEIVNLAWTILREDIYGLAPEVIAEKLDKPVQHINRAIMYIRTRKPDRFDGPAGSDDMDKMTLGDIVGKSDDESIYSVSDFLRTLTDRENIVVLGLLYEKSQTEIGRDVGISQMQVSRTVKIIREKYTKYMS